MSRYNDNLLDDNDVMITLIRSNYELLLSKPVFDPISGDISGASALMNLWILKDNSTKEANLAAEDKIAKDWELSFIDIIHGERRPTGLPEGAVMEGVAQRR